VSAGALEVNTIIVVGPANGDPLVRVVRAQTITAADPEQQGLTMQAALKALTEQALDEALHQGAELLRMTRESA
jgi:hypothetical protein